jgi:hypothetical protein
MAVVPGCDVEPLIGELILHVGLLTASLTRTRVGSAAFDSVRTHDETVHL